MLKKRSVFAANVLFMYCSCATQVIIGLASGLEFLLAGRLLTGVGVAMFVTASSLYSTDVSNVLNRARTMAPLGTFD